MDFLIIGLATWRLLSLLIDEDGPAMIFFRVRERVGPAIMSRWGLDCFWCLSIWMGIVLTGIHWYSPIVIWLCWPFALSAVVILINRIV